MNPMDPHVANPERMTAEIESISDDRTGNTRTIDLELNMFFGNRGFLIVSLIVTIRVGSLRSAFAGDIESHSS